MYKTTQEINNISVDQENNKLLDLRTTMDNTNPLIIRTSDGKVLNQCLYNTSIFPIVYDLTQDTDIGSSEIEKLSKKDGFLVDENRNFLFSKTLLTEHGIGFILASWVVYDSDKIKIRFNEKWLSNWYDSPADNEITIDPQNDVYSWGPVINNQFIDNNVLRYLIPELRFSNDNEFVNNYPIENERGSMKYHTDIGGMEYSNLAPTKISDDNWKKYLLSRKYPGKPLYAYEWDNVTNDVTGVISHVTLNLTNHEFIIPYKIYFAPSSAYGGFIYNFFRCKLNLTDFNENFNNTGATPFEIFAQFIKNEEKKTFVYYHSGEDIEPLSFNEPIGTHNDVNSLKQIVDSNGVTDIEVVAKYTLISTFLDDVNPYEKIPGDTNSKFTYTKVFRANSNSKQYIPMSKVYTTTPPVEEVLDLKLNDTTIKWQTPSEYYSTRSINSSLTDIEDPLQTAALESKNWFWLETIKNWCIYFYSPVSSSGGCYLHLCCWNGVDGWDDLVDIMDLKYQGNYNTLASKYLYSHNFFNEGASIEWNVYSPIRYFDGSILPIYYRTLYLTKDTIEYNYNNNFQNMHDTKIYQTGERNSFSNVGIGVDPDTSGPKKTASNKIITVDESRKAIHAVMNQYCPVVTKQTNGNLAIYFVYKLAGNGNAIQNNSFNFAREIMSLDDVNSRCRDIFGSGDDKTMKDWKRYNVTNTDEENPSDIRENTDDTIYGAANLTLNVAESKINSISLIANRPNPTTNNTDLQDYLERWDR